MTVLSQLPSPTGHALTGCLPHTLPGNAQLLLHLADGSTVAREEKTTTAEKQIQLAKLSAALFAFQLISALETKRQSLLPLITGGESRRFAVLHAAVSCSSNGGDSMWNALFASFREQFPGGKRRKETWLSTTNLSAEAFIMR